MDDFGIRPSGGFELWFVTDVKYNGSSDIFRIDLGDITGLSGRDRAVAVALLKHAIERLEAE